MTPVKGTLLVIISSLMFASYGVWSKLIGPDLGVFYQGWVRALIIVILLIPFLAYGKHFKSIPRSDWGWLTVFLAFTALTQAPLFYAFTHMDIGTATLLFFVSFLLTMYVVGVIFFSEKLNGLKIIAFLLALGGLYLVFSFSLLTFTILAAGMALLNGVASGGEVSFSKKISSHYSTLYLTWLSWVAIVITNAPLSLLLGEAQPFPAFTLTWIWVAGYTIASVLGFWCVIEGLKYVEASIGGLLGLLEVIFSIAFGIFIFSEELSPNVVIGAALILAAAALPHISEILRYRKITLLTH